MPRCTSKNTFRHASGMCAGGTKRCMRWLVRCGACVIDPHPQAKHGASVTYCKSSMLCRLFFLICFPSRRGQVFCYCEEHTKECTIIRAVIDHYSFSPTRVLVNCRTKSLQNRQHVLVQTTGQFILPA